MPIAKARTVAAASHGNARAVRARKRDGLARSIRLIAVFLTGIWCSEASCHSSGCKSRQQRSPVAVVVIPSNGEGDRSVGSLEVKALGGRAYRSDPYRRASNLTGRSKCVNQEAPKDGARVKRIAGGSGVPSCSELGEGHGDMDVLDETMSDLPGVREDGRFG